MIVVYVLTDDPKSDRVKNVKKIFKNDQFIVSIVCVLPTDQKEDKKYESELQVEHHRVFTSLNDCYLNHRDNYCIIVKDTTISNVDASKIAEVVSYVKGKNDSDLLYLCKWMDRCDLYTNKEQVLTGGSMVVKTQSPNGIQCLMFSPNGRDIVLGKKKMKNGKKFELIKELDLGYSLNQEIMNGNIDANCLVPNLVDYDPTAAKCNGDYAKTKECEDINNPNQNTGTSSFWWIIILIIILIIIIFAIVKLKNAYWS